MTGQLRMVSTTESVASLWPHGLYEAASQQATKWIVDNDLVGQL